MIGQTLGHYRILEKIGEGGMGVVYRARDEQLDRDVALKVLPPGVLADEAARKRFRKEALALAKLNHPNIEAVYEFGSQGRVDFLVMEFAPGVTLAERLAAGALPEKEVLALGAQIAAALEEAHEQGVVHRDLKPGNIVMTPKGQAKVLDFGLAKLLRPESEISTTDQLSSTAAAAGTLPYMSPEQLQAKPADARSDIYAAGAVLYEMATGSRPFPEKVATALVADILHKPPPPPGRLKHDLSPRLEDIILKCLEKDPDNRYQSTREMGVDLRRLALPTSAVPATREPSAWRKAAIPVAYGAAGVLVFVAVLVGLNVGGWHERLLGRAASHRIESLAVLPLENLSRDPDQEYFADGMTEALITDLAKIGALKVISRTSVMQYKNTKKPLPKIAKELNVDAVMEGSVQRSGDRVRITAQLIQAPTDKHLWAESYDRPLRDVLALQDEVARAVAAEIQIKLTPQEQAHLARTRPVNPQAYEAYLKGLYYAKQEREESWRASIGYFQQAIQIDPNWPLAYAQLARSYHWVASVGHQEFFSKSKAAALEALARDDTIAEAHSALAFVLHNYDWDWVGAKKEYKRAIELRGSEAHHGYALYLATVGRHEEAIAEILRAQELDPLLIPLRANVGFVYNCAGNTDKAIAQLRGVTEINPGFDYAHAELAFSYARKSMYPEAIAEAQKATALDHNPQNLAAMAYVYAIAGNKRQAAEILTRLKETAGVWRTPVPEVYAALGDKEQALAWLEKAYQQRADSLLYLKCWPEFESLHSDPRFQDLLRRIGLPP